MDEEKITDNATEDENLSEEEKNKLIEKYRTLVFYGTLKPLEKLYIMGRLCDLGDFQACASFIYGVDELKRLAKKEDNTIAKELLMELGLWEETEEEKEKKEEKVK